MKKRNYRVYKTTQRQRKMNTPTFITGSHAYGKPTEESDLNLVIRCTDALVTTLLEMSELEKTVKFGKLNLICCTSDKEYQAWKRATEEMVADKLLGEVQFRNGESDFEKCYDKESAIVVLDNWHRHYGIEYKRKSG